MIRNITFDWSNIISKIEIWSTKGEWHRVTDIVWEQIPIYPTADYNIILIFTLKRSFCDKFSQDQPFFSSLLKENLSRL